MPADGRSDIDFIHPLDLGRILKNSKETSKILPYTQIQEGSLMTRWPGEHKKIKTEKFAEGVDEDNTDFKARGKAGNKHSIYVLEGSPHLSPK